MKRASILFAAVAVCLSTAYGAADRFANAESLSAGKTKTVTLVPEYNIWWERGDDPEDKYYDTGCYFLKISCKKGKAYTVYTSGLDSDEVAVDVSTLGYWDEVESHDAWTGFWDITNEAGYRGLDYYMAIHADDWDEEDPSTVTYIIYVSGEIGDRVTIGFAEGVKAPPVVYGYEETPQRLTVGLGEQKFAGSLLDGDFYFKADLVAGRKYKFGTMGGDEECSLSVSVSGYADLDSETQIEDPEKISEIEEWTDGYNQGIAVTPAQTGPHTIYVSGWDDHRFSLRYSMIGARKIVDHPASVLGAPTPAGVSCEIEPGHRNDPDSGYVDAIIDQALCKVTLAAGALYSFETTGADADLVMELYDAAGNVVKANAGQGPAKDCRIVYRAEKKADYYIGVCERLADDEEDVPTASACQLTVRLVTEGDGQRDAWDGAGADLDATSEGAFGVDPYLGAAGDDVAVVGTSTGERTFGLTDFADTFRFDARNGLIYSFQLTMAPEVAAKMSGLTVKGVLYTGSTAKQKLVQVYDDVTKVCEFTATANASYYLELSVKDGAGVDFGPYDLKVMARSQNGSVPGKLNVVIGGATFAEGATWTIVDPVVRGVAEPAYPGDATVPLAAGTYTIAFAPLKTWSSPANQTVEVKAGETALVSVKYSDLCDVDGNDAVAGDGSKTGKKLTALKPAAKEALVSRSLWHEDEADWFKFEVKANMRYRFAFQDSPKLGDAIMTVYRENGTDAVVCGRTIEFLARETSKSYYLCVSHDTAAKADSQYVLGYSMKQLGLVGFDKASLSVKDSATSVALTVVRSNGKEGRVRVRYTTKANTAKPGVHYLPQSGYLEWADGDASKQTIVVPLIGDLHDRWEADRDFTVELAVVDPNALEGDENYPALGTTVAKVTIQDATKMAPGQVAFSAWGDDEAAFENDGKPAASCGAGERMRLRLSRTNGSDGRIAVSVTTAKGSALPDVDFADTVETVVWEDGDTADRFIEIETMPKEGDRYPTKAFSVKLAADKTVSPTVPSKVGSAVTVTIVDPDSPQTFAEYAQACKDAGLTLKEGKADTWYVDGVGMLRSIVPAPGASASLTLTVAGPLKIAFTPCIDREAGDPSVVSCKIGKETVTLEDGVEVVRYLAKGNQSLTFTVARDKKSTADVSLSFAPGADGFLAECHFLPTPTCISPLQGEVAVAHECADGDAQVDFLWTASDDPEVKYLFTLDADKKLLGTSKAKFCGTAETALDAARMGVVVECSSCIVPGADPAEVIVSGKTYYWRVDTAFVEDGEIKLVNPNTAVWMVSPAICSGTIRPQILSGTNASGIDLTTVEPIGTLYPVTLVAGTAVDLRLAAVDATEGAAVTYTVSKENPLPAGLKLDAVTGAITGVPTKVGDFKTVIGITQTVTEGKTKTVTTGGSLALAFTIESNGLATGSFTGLLVTEEEAFQWDEEGLLPATAHNRLGSLAVTTADNGKISAKIQLGETSVSFSAPSWTTSVPLLDNGLAGLSAVMPVETKLQLKDKTTVVCTNTLELVACRGTEADDDALTMPMTAKLTMNFLSADKTSVISDVVYTGTVVRDNAKLPAAAEKVAPFAGYYTVSLAPTDLPYGAPQGYGYLTLTVAANGATKVTGVLADGSAVSASAPGCCRTSLETGADEFIVPIYTYVKKSATTFGGWLRLVIKDGVSVVEVLSEEHEFLWINTLPASTYEGIEGFSGLVTPVGGYYDTVLNLQTYYLHYAFRVADLGDYAMLPDELLGNYDSYVAYPGLYEDYLTVLGKTISMAKQVTAKRADNPKLIDWENSVNPSNFGLSFKSATGVYTGSFDIYAGDDMPGDEKTQVKLASCKTLQGVLLLNRDADTPALPFVDGVMPGFYTLPLNIVEDGRKRAWTASLPFMIVPEEVQYEWDDPDWTEKLPD